MDMSAYKNLLVAYGSFGSKYCCYSFILIHPVCLTILLHYGASKDKYSQAPRAEQFLD
jgi:hypothetical protein